MSVGSVLVLVILMLLTASLLMVAIRAWRDPAMTGDRVPLARAAPFGREGRAALGRALLPWAGCLMFVCVVGVLSTVRESRGAQSTLGRELRPYSLAAAACIVGSMLLVLTIASFNRPRFLVPPHRRAEQGLVSAWWTGRRGRPDAVPTAAGQVATGLAKLAAASAAGGPAEAPRPTARKAAAFAADGPPGELVIRRSGSWGRDVMRAYEVWVDRVIVTTVKRGGVARIPLDPGDHVVCIQIDWCSSPELAVVVEPGGQTRVSCGPNKTGAGALNQVLHDRGNYVWLREDVAA